MKHNLLKFTLIVLIIGILYHIFNNNLNISTDTLEKKDRTNLYGDYLAGYYSTKISEPRLAAKFFQDALEKAPPNSEIQDILLEYSYISNIMIGNVKNAISLIHKYNHKNNTNAHYLTNIIMVFEDLYNHNFKAARQKLEKSLNDNNLYKTDELLLLILMSWCYVGEGNYEQALSFLQQQPAKEEILILQEAMIADLAGRTDLAVTKYDQLNQLSLSYDIVNLLANFYARHNNHKKAQSLYLTLLAINPNNPIFHKSIQASENPAITHQRIINNAMDGIVFTFTLIGNMLNKEVFYVKSLICSELALYLDPSYEPGHLLVASIFLELNDYQTALKHYRRIDVNSEFYHYAQLEIAKILYKIGEIKNSRYMLGALYQANSNYIEPLMLLANSYSVEGNYIKATDIYTSIISNLSKLQKQDWILFYIRGTNYSLMKNNFKAEHDLQLALRLDPEQYLVMNDLAYTWIENGKNIDQAIKMIKIAYEKDPQNPQVMDSMGWALYLQGNYQEAIDFLEKSIELIPSDTTVSEHLGDAYHKLSYNIQAKYEWERALHNTEDEHMKKRLKKKLEQL